MKKIFLLIAWGALALTAAAQETGTTSPYSRYGLGLPADRSLGFNKGMGGVGLGMADGRQLNLQNPASLARIDSLTFLMDVGLSLQNANLNAGGTKINRHTAQFDYLAMGFRLARNFGISLGLRPLTSVGYDITTKGAPISHGLSGKITPTTHYVGDGGLHEAYVGLGYSPWKPLAVGVNFSYLWGTLTHTATNSYSDATVQPLSRTYDNEVRSYNLETGLQYTFPVGSKHLFTLGLTYGLGHRLNGTSYFYNRRGTEAPDTLTLHDAYQLPHTFGAGLAWQWNNRLRVGIDYTRQLWNDCTAPTLKEQNNTLSYTAMKGQYDNSHKVNFGAEYVDDPDGFTWSGRVRYRLGASYSSPYARIKGQPGPRTYAVGLGVGLPILTLHNNRSFLNLSAQWEHVKPQMPGQITENYLRLSVGITFNERWFQKWKIN